MKNYINIFNAEFVRLIGEFKSYTLNYIFTNLNIYFLFVGLYYGMDKHVTSHQEVFHFMIGLILWWYAVTAIQSVSSIIQAEARQGTLEQLFMTKSNIVHIVLFKLIAQFAFETLQIIGVTILCIITFNLSSIFTIHINYLGILIGIFITMIGLWGIGYFLAGLSILYKRIDAVARAATNIILFFSGLIIPISSVPVVFTKIAKALPFYWAMETVKKIAFIPLSRHMFDFSFFMLCGIAILWIIIGIFIFRALAYQAIKRGSIAHY